MSMHSKQTATTLLALAAAAGGWLVADAIDSGQEKEAGIATPAKSSRKSVSSSSSSLSSLDSRGQIAEFNSATTMTQEIAMIESLLRLDDPDKLRRLLGSIKDIKSEPVRYFGYRIVLARWAEIDKVGALAFAAAVEDRKLRRESLSIAATSWTREDPDAALMAAIAIPSRALSREAMQHVAVVISEEDPVRAYELITTNELQHDQSWSLRSVFQNWAKIDPAEAKKRMAAGIKPWAAANAAKEGYREHFRKQLGTEGAMDHFGASGESAGDLLDRLIRENPEAAVRRPEFEKASQSQKLMYVRAVAKKDPVAAVKWVEENLPEKERRARLAEIAGLAAEKNPSLSNNLLNRVVATDPDASRRSPISDSSTELIVAAWSRDPAGAIGRIGELTNEPMRTQFRAALTKRLAEEDPAAFVAHFEDLHTAIPKPDTNALPRSKAAYNEYRNSWSGYISTVCQDLEKTGMTVQEGALWAKSLPLRLQQRGVFTLFSNWAKVEPVEAARYYDQHFAADYSTANVTSSPLSNMVAYWSDNDPSAAAEWLMTQPAGKRRDGSIDYLMQRWAVQDPAAAQTWLEKLPAGAGRDEGALMVAERIRDQDPAGAVKWAASISSDRRREEALSTTLSRWIRRDPNAAKVAIAGGLAGLSDEERSAWVNRAEQQTALREALR